MIQFADKPFACTRAARPWPAAAAVGLLLGGAGCDLRHPVTAVPIAAPATALRDQAAGAVLLGSATTPIVVAGLPSAVTALVPMRPAEMPPFAPDSYVLLRLSGHVRIVSGPWWPAPAEPIATYTAVEASLATGRAQTNLFVVGPQQGTFQPPMHTAPDGEDRIALVRIHGAPAQLWFSRDMAGGVVITTFGYCKYRVWCPRDEVVDPPTPWFDRVEVERYHVAEAHSVTAMQIAEPLRVEAPEVVAPGQTATFTASPWGDLRLREPARETATVTWMWYAGDTLAVPGTSLGGEYLPQCRQSSCDYAPKQSGRMLAGTYVEGAYVVVRSQVVRVQESTLELECTAPGGSATRAPGTVQLKRTANISCQAFAAPAAELKNVRWSFSGEDFTFPETAEGDPPVETLAWGGQMVMSGTISVRAEINGAEQRKQVSVEVQPRAEFKKKHVQVNIRRGTLEDVPAESRPSDPPGNVTDLGRAMPRASISGYEPAENLDEVLRVVGMIDDEGPNHGLAYLKEVPMQPNAIVVIHPALDRGSAFYRAQAQTSNVVSGTQPCVQSRWDTYVRLVEEHEGLHGNANSHVGAFQAALNPAAAEAVEHVTGRTRSLAAMAGEWTQLLIPVRDNALRQSSNNVFHSTPGGRVQFGCVFNFSVRGR